MTIKVYLCRHGVSKAFAEEIQPLFRQAKNTSLSSKGQSQSQALGVKLSTIHPNSKPTLIVSSEYTRALETAHIVKKYINTPLLINPLLNEITRSVDGLSTESEENKGYKKWYWEAVEFQDITSRFTSKDESFKEVFQRSTQFLQELTQKEKGKNIAVISHSVTLSFLLSSARFGPTANPSEILFYLKKFFPPHSSFSKLKYSQNDWELKEVNSTSHLNQIRFP